MMRNKVVDQFFDFFFYLLVLFAPLIVYGINIGDFSLRFSRLIIVVILPLTILKITINPNLFFRDRFLILIFIPYLTYTAITSYWSPNVETGTVSQRLGGLIEIFLLYVTTIVANLTQERFEKFLIFLKYSLIVPILVCLWQFLNNIYNLSESEVPFSFLTITGKYELLNGRVFVATSGFSRLSSTFAEPTIFGCFMSVTFLILLVKTSKKRTLFDKIIFISVLLVILLTLSKLALILLLFGFLIISFQDKRYFKMLIFILIFLLVAVFSLDELGLSAIFERLTMDTGHVDLLKHTLDEFEKINIFTGASIGSIPYGSWHRFILSRVYESGFVGFLFVLGVCYLPIALLLRKKNSHFFKTNKIFMVAALFCTVLGLNLYDYFIHLWPWLIIGAINSHKISIE